MIAPHEVEKGTQAGSPPAGKVRSRNARREQRERQPATLAFVRRKHAQRVEGFLDRRNLRRGRLGRRREYRPDVESSPNCRMKQSG